MKTEQQTEQQRIECAIDTALLNADLLREQVAELEQALLAETQAKHEAVECLRRIVDGDESGELVELINGILSKHPEAADGVLAAAPAPAERVSQNDWPKCDYCGEVPDCHPWHGSGMFNLVDNPHIHACTDCRHLLPAPVERVEQETVSYYERAHGEKSPTHGMSLDERIAHVGGRTNAAGYMEFGSVMAVSALIDHVLRDSPAPQPAPVAAQDVAGLHLLERIEKHLTNWLELDICECEFGHNCGYNDVIRDRNALRGLIAAHQSGGAR
ncbi:MAG: hypothetical protein KAI82_15115 [Tritonibacter mobilis]|nr:hypothetical protein [Tritonibacter mobilis]